jgi:hypothetical protein
MNFPLSGDAPDRKVVMKEPGLKQLRTTEMFMIGSLGCVPRGGINNMTFEEGEGLKVKIILVGMERKTAGT